MQGFTRHLQKMGTKYQPPFSKVRLFEAAIFKVLLYHIFSKAVKVMKEFDKKNIVLATLSTLGKKSKQIKILSFLTRKLKKYQTPTYRIVIQSIFLSAYNF